MKLQYDGHNDTRAFVTHAEASFYFLVEGGEHDGHFLRVDIEQPWFGDADVVCCHCGHCDEFVDGIAIDDVKVHFRPVAVHS